MEFEYAIFDMDGTLVDSMKQWGEAAEAFLRQIGIEPTRALLRTVQTVSYEELAQVLRERYGTVYEGAEIEQELFRIMRYSYKNTVELKDGVAAYLEYLRGRDIPMCVATATSKELSLYILKKLEILDYFEFVITCPEVGEGKYLPTVFEEALERIGGNKKNTVIFEDSLSAIQTAKKAGFRVIGVCDETSMKDRKQIIKLTENYVYALAELGRE